MFRQSAAKMARGGAATSLSLVVVILMGSLCVSTSAFNITQVLESFPDYSQLNDWLTRTGVADEINNRSTLTILAPSNSVLDGYIGGVPNAWTDPDKVGDTLRYHVLLGFFGIPQLQELPSNGTSVTTLLQTTGRANESQGFVTLYNNGTSFLVGHEFVDTYGNETILSNVTSASYEYSVLQVSALLTPVPPSLPSPSPAPSPLSKVPSPSPSKPTSGPAAAAETNSPDKSHASSTSASKFIVLAMLFASGVALL